MIVRLTGQLVEKQDIAVVLRVNGIDYEVFVPASVLQRIDQSLNDKGEVSLITYHYLQLTQSSGSPMLVGFLSEVERDFFLQFIKVSGIGPRAAVKALSQPIAEITHAIEKGDAAYLKTLPGIGMQRAKEIVAKLQGKIGKFGLIRDNVAKQPMIDLKDDVQTEAMDVLLQLQYTKQEAEAMIRKVMERSKNISSVEDLLNEIYQQKVS